MRAGNKPCEVSLSPCDPIQSLSLLVQNSDLDKVSRMKEHLSVWIRFFFNNYKSALY